ncbi:MAG: ATP phosphoribosyltransferase regulatory subunit [Betaproteobacteria bacterium]|nr:ATP phosphoribosyltransferase regulatory subunit [Betaproteobacteria bacterium]
MRNWLLPEYFEDVLPAEAERIEALRRRILDLFSRWGYQLVMPPMLEYLESLLTGTGHDLDLRTFKLVDQLSGRMMGLRADITPQVARIDAHLMNREGVTRLCYAGSVLHTRPAGAAATREPLQIGAEIYGHAGVESDLEIQRLLCAAMAACGARGARIDIGHVAVFRAIVRLARAGRELESELFTTLQRKDLPGIRALTRGMAKAPREALLLLPELYGGPEVLQLAARRLPRLPEISAALATLRRLARVCDIPAGFDLAELRGYHYHSGVVFDAYCKGVPGPVARGGRYDEVGVAFGRPRPATGFSIELRELTAAVAGPAQRAPILAPPYTGANAADAALGAKIAALRARGEIVIEELPGHERYRAELGCTRRLAKVAGKWTLQPLKPKRK